MNKKDFTQYIEDAVLKAELPVIKQAMEEDLAKHSYLFNADIWTQWRKIELD